MDQVERDNILHSASLHLHREGTAPDWVDPYSDMTPDEKSKLIDELLRLRQSDQTHISSLMSKLEGMSDSHLSMQDELKGLRSEFSELLSLLRSKDAQNAVLQKEIVRLSGLLQVSRKHTYGSKSQKGLSSKKEESKSHQEEKDDFDGSSGSVSSVNSQPVVSDSEESQAVNSDKTSRLYRQGMEYKSMSAERSVSHASSLGKLPPAAEVMGVFYKYSYEQVCQIVEHQYQVVRYKMPDGRIYEGYFPEDGEPSIIDRVPGTHASCDFLAYLVFNRFVLNTPLYRELSRLGDERMRLSRMTLTNWLAKGGVYVTELIRILKDKALEKDSVINCDETWCRVKVAGRYMKKYLWCLVNKEAKIAIYCYEDGSRGRQALQHILGDSQVKSLQSDGYNVYMYLDDALIATDHLCCMAHARAKFKYALEQGGDRDAGYFLECMGELYALESDYVSGHLSPEQICLCRGNLRTKDIIGRLRSKLDAMLAEGHPPRGELMEKALRYLNTFWPQLFAYLKDGRYNIDNSLAERFIRPLAGERKNSLFFGSSRMANVSAAYHTIISTCKMHGISVLEFFKKFFREIMAGRRDYENLLPMTIGIKPNKF